MSLKEELPMLTSTRPYLSRKRTESWERSLTCCTDKAFFGTPQAFLQPEDPFSIWMVNGIKDHHPPLIRHSSMVKAWCEAWVTSCNFRDHGFCPRRKSEAAKVKMQTREGCGMKCRQFCVTLQWYSLLMLISSVRNPLVLMWIAQILSPANWCCDDFL